MKNILFIQPHKLTLNVLQRRENCFYYLDNNLYKFKDGNIELISNYRNNFNTLKKNQIENLKKRIHLWAPTWTRWISKGYDYENLKATLIFELCKFNQILEVNNIEMVIFSTGIPHHPEIAGIFSLLQEKKIMSIFLFVDDFIGRLIPLKITDSLLDKETLNFKISQFSFQETIKEYRERSKKNLYPKNTGLVGKFWQINFYVAALVILIFPFYKKIKRLIFNKKKEFLLFNYPEYNFIEHLFLINQQRIFLNEYKKKQISLQQFFKGTNSKSKKIIFYAHMQPEATSFPEGGHLYNNIEIILALRAKGYKKEILYKEHFGSTNYLEKYILHTRIGINRNLKYLRMLESLNCKFLNINEKVDLINDSCIDLLMPLTICGSIAIERSLSGLHTIITGYPWWREIPGVIHIDNLNFIDLKDEYFQPNDLIAKGAIDFLNSKLSNKTLSNPLGIGVGHLENIDERLNIENQFSYEMNKFLNHLELNS